MPFNVDNESIKNELEMFAFCSMPDMRKPTLFMLLQAALLRPLAKEIANDATMRNIRPIKTLPRNAPGWLTNAFNNGEKVYEFAPDADMMRRVSYINNWLAAAMENEESWLNNTDKSGRPKKLLKLGTMEQAKREADKALLIYNQRQSAKLMTDHSGEQTIMTFDNGYRIVELLTSSAMDRESEYVGHCIGNGDYANRMAAGTHRYYSLRDRKNEGHATMEVLTVEGNILLQCKGKGNKIPVRKYMPSIQKFLMREDFDLDEASYMTGLVKAEGQYYSVYNLPENLTIDGNLNLSHSNIRTLPAGLRINGDLNLNNSEIQELPPGLKINGSLSAGRTSIRELPQDLYVLYDVYLRDSKIKHLPDNFDCNGHLDIAGTKITKLPKDLIVEGNLNLNRLQIPELPEALYVGGDLTILLNRAITELPNDLEVGGNLTIEGAKIKSLPEKIKVKGIITLPNGWYAYNVREAKKYMRKAGQDPNYNPQLRFT